MSKTAHEQQNIYVAFLKRIATIEGQEKLDTTVLGGLPLFTDSNTREFDPSEKLAEDEWAYIQLSGGDTKLVERYFTKNNDTQPNKYVPSDETPIAIFEYSNDDYLIFRVITPKMMIRKSILFRFTENVVIERPSDPSNKGSFLVDELPSAIYEIATRKLFFREFRKITRLFIGIDKFYRQASESEVSIFKAEVGTILEIDEKVKLGTRNLSLIAQLIDAKETIDANRIKRIHTLARKFPECGIIFEDKKPFHISTDKQLNSMLKLIQGWYYENPVTDDHMEANSAKPIGGKK